VSDFAKLSAVLAVASSSRMTRRTTKRAASGTCGSGIDAEPRHDVEDFRVRDAFFFLSIAGLGTSVAGLAGLVSAFRRGEDAWDRVESWRLRAMARLSFTCVFLALPIFPMFALLGEQATSIRLASAAIAGLYVIEIILAFGDRLNWPRRAWMVGALLPDGAFGLFNIVNTALAWADCGKPTGEFPAQRMAVKRLVGWCPRQDLNLCSWLRRPVLYPG
jgi:hypothetical protein